ncbi:MAG: hypothetical protein U5K43_09995 [Halofilum sp. (in: g-proteobacteria)]|nr:hypothetical protein [Halofilum sp. (in: g-proteobacteria)]
MPRPTRSTTLAIALLATAAAGPAVAADLADAPALDSLGSGQFSLVVSGDVEASGRGLSVEPGDVKIDDDEVLNGEVTEKAAYTLEPMSRDAARPQGPYVVQMMLGGERVALAGADVAGVLVSLHLLGEVEAGTHSIDEAFFDIGPGAAPVSVMVAAASGDREVRMMFSQDAAGTLELTRFDPDGASGRFAFEMRDHTDSYGVTAVGAFKDIPYAALPEDD